MTELSIAKLAIEPNASIDVVGKALSELTLHPIETSNWDKYKTDVRAGFQIAYTSNAVLLRYSVLENEVLAQICEDNGKVCTDSCVEFFISFDDKHYYNIEFSCIGKVLMGYRATRPEAVYANPGVLKSIKRLSSLGKDNFDKKLGQFEWSLTLVIPKTAFWMSDIKAFDGMKAKGNFYKCGDNLTLPHYLTWAPIETEKPSFHQPSFFGLLKFED